MTDRHEDTVRESLMRVINTFVVPSPKRERMKPHRCFDCKKVTKHIFCPECSELRRQKP